MATTNKGLNLPAAGSTGWNVPLNANTDILDKAFGSFTTVSSTGGVTNLTSDQVQNMCIKSTTSAFLANVTYRIPSGIAGQWVIQNQSAASAYTLTVSSAGGGTSAVVGVGTVRSIYSDGTNVVYADTPSTGDFVNASVSGTLTLGGGDLTGVASQAEAEAGTDNVKVMTPLRVSEALTALANYPFKNAQIFTSSGTFTTPSGVTQVFAYVIGGGGGGAGSNSSSALSGNGGVGGGGFGFVSVSGDVAVTIGAGGNGSNTTNGTAGGSSTFSSITATGGARGISQGADGADGTVTGASVSYIASQFAASFFAYAIPLSTLFPIMKDCLRNVFMRPNATGSTAAISFGAGVGFQPGSGGTAETPGLSDGTGGVGGAVIILW